MLIEISRFVNWVRRRNPESRTWRDYGYDLKIFVSVVGDRCPSEITFRDVDNFVNYLVSLGRAPATVNRKLAAVVSFYTFLSDDDPTLVCPVIPRRHSMRVPDRLPRPVPEDDVRKFFAVIDNARDRAMFILMLRCGLRISEVAKLLLVDLYLEEDRPRLVVRGKCSRERSIYLSPQAETALRTYLDERPEVESDFVFLSYLLDGLSTTAIQKRLMHYREAAGVYLTAHQLRHSFANDLVSADVPVTTIQKLLGHRWLETTQVYVRANDKKVKADFYAACSRVESWAYHMGGSL